MPDITVSRPPGERETGAIRRRGLPLWAARHVGDDDEILARLLITSWTLATGRTLRMTCRRSSSAMKSSSASGPMSARPRITARLMRRRLMMFPRQGTVTRLPGGGLRRQVTGRSAHCSRSTSPSSPGPTATTTSAVTCTRGSTRCSPPVSVSPACGGKTAGTKTGGTAPSSSCRPALPRGHHPPLPEQLRTLIRLHNHVSQYSAKIQLRAAAHIGPVEHDGKGFVGAHVNHLFACWTRGPSRTSLAASTAELALCVSD